MRDSLHFRNEPWLASPCQTKMATIKLAGEVHNVPALNPAAMRVLGSYSLIYLLDVDGFYCDANGVSRDIGPGDVLFIYPELAHAYGPKEGRRWSQIYVVFEGPQFDLWREAGVLDPSRPVLTVQPVDYWRRRLEEVFTGTPRLGEAGALRVIGRFLQVLTDVLATNAEATRAPGDAWLENSLHLLAERSERGWLSPHDVAREVGLSYDNFRKQFARRTGQSPGQFQKQRRIDHACAAIYQGTHGFKELAEELGFCDVFHFSKAFKQVVGDTPSEFRKKVRGH